VTVDALRETLTRLTALLEAADAKPATTRGLAEFVELTGSFGELSLKAFVTLAEAGRTPRADSAGAGRPKSTAKAKADPGAVEAEVRDLYARAGEPAVTIEQVRAACVRLGTLKKDGLIRVAEAIELHGAKGMKNGDLVGAITSRLVDRKETAVRRTLIDRPAAVNDQPPPTGPARVADEPHVLRGG
jgi:hypothetical protein